MGCGQSKINLYPRRSKSKGGSRKSASAIDKEESEEEEESPEHVREEEAEAEVPEADPRQQVQHVLPIADHQPTFEVSVSQQNFFKMLDEKIERGKDYNSDSDTEIHLEEERKRKLIEHWRSYSQSTQSSVSQSPPTPAGKRRLTRSISKISERQCAPGPSKYCYRQESPPTRRSHSEQSIDPRPSTSDWDPAKSPVKRTQSAGPSWRSNPKVAPMPKGKSDQKDEAIPGCSKDSQITYNPTFQNHSPAHSSKSQPYVAQIVSYPLSHQVTPPSPSKYIAPPEQYQDPEAAAADRQVTGNQVTTQSQIYYIHGNSAATSTPDIVQQRQQTAMHLQQYVAMKQAQQQMFSSYMQRSAHAVFPGAEPPANTPRMYEGEELAAQYGYPGPRSQSAPNRPSFAMTDVTHMHAPMWSPLPPVMTTPWVGGQVPPEMQYYPQSQFVPMFRANSAGSAGTLTRIHKKDEEKSVISVVRSKPVGQIVAVGAEGLAVTVTVGDSPSPASVSTDSGVSPGTSAPSSKSSFSTTPPTTRANDTFDPRPKKNKSGPNRLKVSKSLDT